jgi:hypothetical protein
MARRFSEAVIMTFSGRRIFNVDYPSRVLGGTLFFKYVLYEAALSHLRFGIPPSVAGITVWFMIIIVRFVRSIMILVLLCGEIISWKTIPHFRSFS